MGIRRHDGSSGMMGMGMGMMGMDRPTSPGPEHMTEEEIDHGPRPGLHRRARHDLSLPGPGGRRQPELQPRGRLPGRRHTRPKEFAGPWSEPTDPVNVPADVAIFAMEPGRPAAPTAPTRSSSTSSPGTPTPASSPSANFPAAPGEFVGEATTQLLVAVEGEDEPAEPGHRLPEPPAGRRHHRRPAAGPGPGPGRLLRDPGRRRRARPDGSIALHNQAVDATDEQLAFMKESYSLSISKELNKKSKGNDMGMMDDDGGLGGMSGRGRY